MKVSKNIFYHWQKSKDFVKINVSKDLLDIPEQTVHRDSGSK